MAPPGRYSFRLNAAAPSGARARSATTSPVSARDAFDLLPHIFPVRGRHNYGQGGARFGAGRGGRSHQGHDIMAKCGTRMVAARGGKVKAKGYQSAAGNYLVITGSRTGQDYAYMHLTEPSPFDRGDRVLTGQRIGTVGDTGNARGCHLHFELWRRARAGTAAAGRSTPSRPCWTGTPTPRRATGPGRGRTGPPAPRTPRSDRRGWPAGRALRPGASGSPERRARAITATTATTFGTISASPIEVGIMPLKMGLRTMAKGPSVTRSVRSAVSTPIRHELPIAI